MPLAYEVRKNLILPPDTFNNDGLAVIVADGARYGGRWSIGAFEGDIPPSGTSTLGEIWTEPHGDPAAAFGTAILWVASAAVRAGNRLVHTEDLHHLCPVGRAPVSMLGRIVIGNEDYLAPLPPPIK